MADQHSLTEDYETPYKFNGKELDSETGLYYYGARYYDPRTSIWLSTDPLMEKYPNVNPYLYTLQNPINMIDPDGRSVEDHDYGMNVKTGEVKLLRETGDKTDRLIELDKKGVETGKVVIDNIQQGILKDGQNWKNDGQVISVGGKDQASVDGVKNFTLKFSEYIGKEIKGYSYSSNGSKNVTDIIIGKYLKNTYYNSSGNLTLLRIKYSNNFSLANVLEEFHTHPDGKLGATQSDPHLSGDVRGLNKDKPSLPNARFTVLYRIFGVDKPAEYDYTHHYNGTKKK